MALHTSSRESKREGRGEKKWGEKNGERVKRGVRCERGKKAEKEKRRKKEEGGGNGGMEGEKRRNGERKMGKEWEGGKAEIREKRVRERMGEVRRGKRERICRIKPLTRENDNAARIT